MTAARAFDAVLGDAAIVGQVGGREDLACLHDPLADGLRRVGERRGQRARRQRTHPARIVHGKDEPARRGHPLSHPLHERVGHAFWIEAGIDGPNHLGEHVGSPQLAPERRL